jgi:hypothetical protein
MLLAILSGILLGFYFARNQTNYILIILLFYRFRTKEKYEDLFELSDSELDFDMTKDMSASGYNTYHDFLLRHQQARPVAGDIFRWYWHVLTTQLIKVYAVVLVVVLILFHANMLYFLAPFISVHLGFMAYYYFYKENKLGFYATLLHSLVLNHENQNPASEYQTD